jgi:hypothetical protein
MPKLDFKEQFTNRTLKWDRYERFHVQIGQHFVLFDSGEMIVTTRKARPHERGRTYHGLTFLTSHDRHDAFRMMYADKARTQPVKQSWLSSGLYLIDHEQNQMVYLDSYALPGCANAEALRNVPEWVIKTGFTAYCGGNERDWISAAKVGYFQTVRLSKAHKDNLRLLKKCCEAADRVGGLPMNIWQIEHTAADRLRKSHFHGTLDPMYYETLAYEDLTTLERVKLARNGWSAPKVHNETQSLWIGAH